MCGGIYASDLYESSVASAPWIPLGCYTDITNNRTLSTYMSPASGDTTLTVEKCQGQCGASKFKYSGVEASRECYCGNEIRSVGKLTAANEWLV